jgi:hypothetical protein
MTVDSASRHHSETFVVVLVRANPFPEKDAAGELANGATVVTHRTDQLGLPIDLNAARDEKHWLTRGDSSFGPEF